MRKKRWTPTTAYVNELRWIAANLAILAPETIASTNSVTWALFWIWIFKKMVPASLDLENRWLLGKSTQSSGVSRGWI